MAHTAIRHCAHVHVVGRGYTVAVSVCLTSQRVHIFKYNQQECQYGIFESAAEAEQFIAEPLPGIPQIGR
jgi:hypothetical protein